MDKNKEEHHDRHVGRKTIAMISIGILATLAIVSNGVFAWFYSPQDQAIINSIIEFLKNVVLTVIGYLAGASKPDESRSTSTLQNKSANIDSGIDSSQENKSI